MDKEYYSILEVANLLDITTQAVYKRLQQDGDTLDAHVEMVSNKKSLSIKGVETLAELMNLDNPFTKETETDETDFVVVDNENTDPNAQNELLDYLRNDNARLREEVEELKKEITQTRALREDDKQNALEERKEFEEARKRTDTLLMQAIMNQESIKRIEEEQSKAGFWQRLFGLDKKKDKKSEEKKPENDNE